MSERIRGSETLRPEALLATFDHHNPEPDQIERIQMVRAGAKAFASIILDACNQGADRTCALRKLHEAMMTANKAIVLEPRERSVGELPE